MFRHLNEHNKAQKALDDEMVDSFFTEADKRTGPRTSEDITEAIKARNSYRFWRLQHDLKWFRKELKRLGYSPDDFREFL